MNGQINWLRVLHIAGVVALIIGAIDPLEGSVVIAGGIVMLALAAYLRHDRHRQVFLLALVLILVGVAALFYLSSLGGFGGSSALSWWWGLFILPYPIGWLTAIVTLIVRAVQKPRLETAQ